MLVLSCSICTFCDNNLYFVGHDNIRNNIQGGAKKRTPILFLGCPLYWTTP